jgi:predicted nucleotidyltransferase
MEVNNVNSPPSLPKILQLCRLMESEVLNVYPYGSQNYGTMTVESDYDFIIVVKDEYYRILLNEGKVFDKEEYKDECVVTIENVDACIQTLTKFSEKLKIHSPDAVESVFLPKVIRKIHKLNDSSSKKFFSRKYHSTFPPILGY